MSQKESIEDPVTGDERESDPPTDAFGERVVLNVTSDADALADLQDWVDAVLGVFGEARNLGRAEITEQLETALRRIGRDTHSVEVAELTDKILRGSHSSLIFETDDGVVLGYAEGGGAGHH